MKIEIKNVEYTYGEKGPSPYTAITDINLTLDHKSFTGLIGHTGSGKSTLVQHLNGIYKPSKGEVLVGGKSTRGSKEDRKKIREEVGLVFQYPEAQLFEETVFKDIAFGPTNMGLSQEKIEERVKDSMKLVGLDYEKYKDASPFDLSGGQKRRVAIAGVLSMHPKILVLDEPTAGLDPKGRDEILSYLKDLHTNKNIGVILVSHSMEDVGRLCDRVIVMGDGRVQMDGPVSEIFEKSEDLKKYSLTAPDATLILDRLREKYPNIKKGITTVKEAAEEIDRVLKERGNV